MIFKKRYIALVLLFLCLCFLTYCVGVKSGLQNSKLSQLEMLIAQYYPFDYDESLMEEYAAKGLAASVGDPY